MTASARSGATSTAALLYAGAVVAGLVAISVLRARAPTLEWHELPARLGPLWVGSIGGIALGLLLSVLRVRAWVPVTLLVLAWFSSGSWALACLEEFLDGGDRMLAYDALVAFAPAVTCGYLALAERGALVAFWYPAMLWVVVILDSRSSEGAGGGRAALPFVVGLGALFVMFLRSRETRRALLWRESRAGGPVAATRARSVLRASPVRIAADHLMTALVVGTAIVATASVAPALWNTERGSATASPLGSAREQARRNVRVRFGAPERPTCCREPEAAVALQEPRRVSEYLPLLSTFHERAGDPRYEAPSSCLPCMPRSKVASDRSRVAWAREHGDVATDEADETAEAGQAGQAGEAGEGPATYVSTYPTGGPTPLVSTGSVATQAPRGKVGAPPPPPTPPAPVAAPARTTTEPAVVPATAPTHAFAPVAPVPPARAPTPAPDASGNAFRWAAAGAGATLAMLLLGRVLRRALVVRHLARPFWRESIDQQISNHWHRMLIGLRDAGICPLRGEPPATFARRVGIEGMERCSQILERARHGVRIEPLDLQAMGASSNAVYGAARRRAGAMARVVGWFRARLA